MSCRARFAAIFLILGAIATGLSACRSAAGKPGDPWALGFSPLSTEETGIGAATATPFSPAPVEEIQIFNTPTPNPPADLPPLREETDIYTVQPGDSLMIIALRYGVTVQQIIAFNDLTNPDYLEVGQVLEIPAPAPLDIGPAEKIIPDSELVNGPAAADFDTRAYVAAAGGYLAGYSEEVNGVQQSGAEIIAGIAHDFSVNPRLLLALLEHQSGWLSQKNPKEKTYPLGLQDEYRKGLYRQLSWAADNLNQGYYLWRVGALSAYALADGSIVPASPTINAGTAGVQYFFSRLHGYEDWNTAVREDGLLATYQALFGYPFQYAVEPLLPEDLAQPDLQLPFEPGVTWNFTGGPHGGWADGSAWAALDFAPPGDALGCVTNNAWVTAAADGLITYAQDGQVLQDLDGDGNDHTGWVIVYMHIDTRNRVQPGSLLKAGDRIGHPSCEGGYSTGTHLHIARRYNGEWIPADQGDLPFVMDGWVSAGSGYVYDGWLVKGNRTVTADNGRSEENEISR